MSTSSVINLLSVLTIVGQGMTVCLLALLIYRALSKKDNRLLVWLSARGVLFAWVVALAATLGSLYLSEIALFPPCKLCWFQRIFIYPQAVILLLATLWPRHRSSATFFGLVLSGIGILFSSYHYYIQVISPRIQPCSLTDTVSCTEKVVIHYGYITIPLMTFTAFALIILFLSMAIMRGGLEVRSERRVEKQDV